MTHPVYRIEEMLQYWEDNCHIFGTIAEHGRKLPLTDPDYLKRYPFIGPLRHWRELRSHLRTVARNRLALDQDRFSRTSRVLMDSDGSLFQYPGYLYDWTLNSRRVFHLSEELQALLTGMSFAGVRWSDIELPFDSFAITLETPIVTDVDLYDACIVSCGRSEGALAIGLLSEQLGERKAFDQYDRDRLTKLLRRGGDGALGAIKQQLTNRLDPGPFVATMYPGASQSDFFAESPLSEHVLHISKPFADNYIEPDADANAVLAAMDQTYRLVAAFCLYLMSLPPGSPHRSPWDKVPPPAKPDPRLVTNDAQVCTVTSSFTLTSEERDIFLGKPRGPGSELTPHWRRGHFRRRPGEGSDPNAPKVVLVRPALVRADKQREGELPQGALTTVKP